MLSDVNQIKLKIKKQKSTQTLPEKTKTAIYNPVFLLFIGYYFLVGLIRLI